MDVGILGYINTPVQHSSNRILGNKINFLIIVVVIKNDVVIIYFLLNIIKVRIVVSNDLVFGIDTEERVVENEKIKQINLVLHSSNKKVQIRINVSIIKEIIVKNWFNDIKLPGQVILKVNKEVSD